jgi:hypothetical protein
MSRSAMRARAMKLGRACTRCGSCIAVVATRTLARLPAISLTNAPHSASQAKTLSAADAGKAIRHRMIGQKQISPCEQSRHRADLS